MGGSTTQNTSQSSTTNPWAPAIPMLTNILGQIGQGNMSPTGAQTSATNQVASEAAGSPSFGTQGTNTINGLFNVSTQPQQNTLTSAYNTSAGALSPMLSQSWMDPNTNPYLASELATTNQDITNQIEGQFAAAGRPMGTNAAGTQALARGLSQGESGVLTNEFNTLAGQTQSAANQLPGLASSYTGALTGQQQVPLASGLQGISAAGSIPGLLTQPGMTNLTAANMQAGLPLANLQQLEGLTLPVAGMGAQSQGTGTTTQSSPWYTTALGAGLLGYGLFSSDERIKENIAKVGELHDGQNVYSFNYKDDHTKAPRIGLLAQEVEKKHPEAVAEIGGVKHVHYGKATEHARALGMLHQMAA